MKNLANIITLARIVLSLSLFFFTQHYPIFIIVYLLCGLSDIFDGYIARKAKMESTLGAKLDSVADLIMYGVIIAVLIIWDWQGVIGFIPAIIIITLIRIINIVIAYFKFHQFAVIHTFGNKFVGLLAFTIPLIYIITHSFGIVWLVLSIALLASLEETCLIIRMKELDLNRKSLF